MRSSSLPASAKQLFAVATSIALLSSSLFPSLAHASSSTRNPIAALTPLQQPRILTNQGRVTALHSDFDLTFGLNDQVDVRLRLEPNHDILADDTHVSYLAADGSITHSENIDRSAHKVFKGTAWVRKANHPEEDGDDAQDRTQPQWQRAGWARVSIFRDGKHPVFQGAFSVDRDHHHIQTATGYMRTRHAEDPIVDVDGLDEYMVLWRDSDILPDFADHRDLKRSADAAPACGADELSFNTQEDHPVYAAMKSKRSEDLYGSMDFSRLFARQIDGVTGGNSAGGNLLASIGKTAGCPTTRKVALVGVAMDCTYTADFNSTQSARENVIDQMNTASGVWENAFNISLGLQNVTVSDANCPGTPNSATAWNQACSDNVDIQARLNLFSAWRGEQQDNNSHWTLLSTCATQSAVGLAWLGQACVHNSMSTNGSVTGEGQSGSGEDVVAGANVVVRTQGASEWQIIAHETGHTFGAVHDCTDQSCANPNVVNAQQCCPLSSSVCDAGERYIMNPQSSQGIREFSPCSIGNVCSALGRNSVKGDCLTDNRGIKTFTGQQCGNGIVEAGEDCDCGGETGCKNDPCCNPTTCKFTQGSVCDDANEDCCRQCQFASAGTVCRASTSECDPEETCPGDSASCPVDKNKEDGSSCGKGLQCSSGQCTSRDQQCKTVMGSYTQGNDTYACDSSGCAISCASPEFGPNVCYGLQQNFLDGTTCGGGGRCSNGQCRGSTVGGQVKSWIQDNKALVIGICAAIGGLLLFSLLGCLFRCCKRNKHRQPAGPPPGGWPGWNGDARGAPVPMQQQQHGGYYAPPSHPSQGWGDPHGGNQAWSPPPPVPPPTYSNANPQRGWYA